MSGAGELKFLARKKGSRLSVWTCTGPGKCWINCIL